jgi:hypothetical protein
MKTALALLLLAQLVAPKITIPQIMSAKFATAAPIKAGRKADVTVTFNVINGFKINRDPKVSLVVTPVTGVKLEKTKIEASPVDPKAIDEYYVNLPTLKIAATASKAGKYELPGKLTYFYCSKADGFCSKQTVDVKIPLQVD